MDQDILYHIALGSGSHDLIEMFGDVKVCNCTLLNKICILWYILIIMECNNYNFFGSVNENIHKIVLQKYIWHYGMSRSKEKF